MLLKQTKTNNAKEHNITVVSKSVSGLILFMSRPIIIHRTVTSLAWSLTRSPLLFGCSCASSMRDFAPLETKPDITGQSWTEGLEKVNNNFALTFHQRARNPPFLDWSSQDRPSQPDKNRNNYTLQMVSSAMCNIITHNTKCFKVVT